MPGRKAVKSRAPRVKRPAPPKTRVIEVGPFKVTVDADLGSSLDASTKALVERFRRHLSGLSGPSRPVGDPDEYEPPSRPRPSRPSGMGNRMPMRPGSGTRPDFNTDDDDTD
jgi:hypothetical protein